MPTTIDSLELEVQSSSTSAVSGIDALSSSLSKLKNAVKGGAGLTSVVNQLKSLNTAISGIDGASAGKLDTLSNSLSKLSELGNIKISSSIGNQLKNIGTAATSLNGVDFSGIGKLSTALQSLTVLGKSNLTSFITQLGKLPQLAQTLRDMNITEFTGHIQQLSNALAPLASQLNTVATAFSRLPANIRNTVSATNTIARANNTASTSYINLWAKCRMAMNVVKTGARVIASWITESNSYIENLNLFTASMGEYASEAQKYAEIVGEIMGIDPGQFMRNQGVFMTITEGFGVVSDRAYTMSKNLTQLGYDLSSFFNISFQDSMQKLQSGISGELEPLRRLGYDLSQARLQQEALNLGIDKSISKMTQAEKAQIRYYAIMTQVTVAQGDMARTLNAPANQLRVLQAQVTQCARALGNIFIPSLNAVLPYVIGFVKLIRMAADAIASLFGFKLPEVDYSGIDAGSSAAGDLADGLGDAIEKAKKFKKTIMGFDELNILNDNNASDSLGDSLGGLEGGDLGFELPTYDFLKDAINSQIQELVDKFKEWAGLTEDIDTWAEFFHTKLGRILTTVGAIALGLAAWKISKGVLSGLQYLQTLKGLGLKKPLTISLGVSLAITGIALEASGIIDAIQNELNSMNFAQIIGGGSLITTGGALIGKALGSAVIGGGIGAIVAGIPAFITGIYDSIVNGIDWLSATLTAAGATAAGAGIGAIIGGPIGAGIGALIGLAVGLITDFGIWLYQNWDSVSAWFVEKWEAVKNFFTSTVPGWWNGAVVPFFQGIPEWFGSVLESIRVWFVEKWTAITDFMSALPEKIGNVISAIGNWFSELPEKIGYGLGYAFGSVAKWVTGVWNTLQVEVPKIVSAVGTWFTELPGNVWNAISSTASKIAQWASGVWNTFQTKVGEIINAVGKWFSELPGKIYSAISGAVAKIGQWASDMIAKIKQVVPEIINRIVEFFKELPSKLYKLGSDIWNGLVNGLKNAWTTVTTAIGNFVKGFINGFKNALGIHSPSTVMQSIGQNIVAGLQNGMSNIGSVFTTVFKTVSSGIGNFGKNMFTWGSELMGNLVSGINGGLKSLAEKVSSAAGTIRSYLHFSQPDIGPLSDFNSWMPDMMSQLAEGIAHDEGKVKKQIDKLANTMSLDSTLQANVSAHMATPVANTVDDNDSGLVNAVYTAVSSALAGQNEKEESGTPIIINLGNEQIASFLVKQNKRVALISGGKA